MRIRKWLSALLCMALLTCFVPQVLASDGITVSLVCVDGESVLPFFDLAVTDGTAERYGFEPASIDHAGKTVSGVTVFDVLVAAHARQYPDFSAETAAQYLEADNGFITKSFGVDGSSVGFTVNDQMPHDGVYNGGFATGYAFDTARVESGDCVCMFRYRDKAFGDLYPVYTVSGEVKPDKPFTVRVQGSNIMLYGCQKPEVRAENLASLGGLALECTEDYRTFRTLAVLDDQGEAALTLPGGQYDLVVRGKTADGTPAIAAPHRVQVSESPCVTAAEPPKTADTAELKWSYRPGTDYQDACSVPAVYGDQVYVMHGSTLERLNGGSGKAEASAKMMSTPSYAIVGVTCTDDGVYCPLEGGIVQAFSRSALDAKWSYTDPLGGQALSPVVARDGLLFTGFWNEEDAQAAYVCLDAASGNCLWRVTRTGGYYYTTCLVSGSYVLLGGDDGARKTGTGTLQCLDKKTGAVLSEVPISGDHRSGILSYDGAYYLATKGGVLYKVSLNAGQLTVGGSVTLPGAVTATPIGYGGKLYLAVQDGRTGSLLVLDAKTLAAERKIALPGYTQGDMLLRGGEAVRLYATCNTPPGSLYVIDPEAPSAQTLYTPAEAEQGYCISSVRVLPDGTLLYKNDSGAVFAVGTKTPVQKLSFFRRLLARIRAFWRKVIAFFTGGQR